MPGTLKERTAVLNIFASICFCFMLQYRKRLFYGVEKDKMKRLVSAIIILLLCCGCVRVGGVEEDGTQAITSKTGGDVPVYNDVTKSLFDPELFVPKDGRMRYSGDNVRVFTGVDVSVFQGDIDWRAVAADGIDFAVLRVGGRGYGGGEIYEDGNFKKNYAAASKAGLDIGIYFFSQAITPEEAIEEAAFVLEKTKELDIKYPIAYDFENIGDEKARTASMSKNEISLCAAAFCDTIEKSGREAIIYFNRSAGYENFDLSALKNYKFWLAEYSAAPTFIYTYEMWQYTETGSVDGIAGNVDLNIALEPII